VWNAEDQVIVADRKQFALTSAEPLLAGIRLAFGAMPISAGAVRGGFVAAADALIAVTAERCGSAALDGGKDFELRPGQ
jgi:hypothetical protein